MIPLRILIVVDSNPISNGFTWGDSPDDSLFTLHTLLGTLQEQPYISVDTAHRSGDKSATVPDPFPFSTPPVPFNFRRTIPDLTAYDEIWLFGYDGSNGDTSPGLGLADDELLAINRFMNSGGGLFATGDHAGLGSKMCGKIPRVRSMRKWYQDGDTDLPAGAPTNWPGGGTDRADTLVQGRNDEWDFDNQSDDKPQTLLFPGGFIHPILNGSNGPINTFPDHMHEGEVLGFGGISGPDIRTPWNVNEPLSIGGEKIVEYPTFNGHQELPQIIATGTVTGGHTTTIESSLDPRGCESQQFSSDTSAVSAKSINILSVYDGHAVGVGRVVTDSSFHHYLDLNLTGDPCSIAPKTLGFGTDAGQPVMKAMQDYYVNLANWLAGPQFSSITATSPDGITPTAFFTHGSEPLSQAILETAHPGTLLWIIFNNLPGQAVRKGSGLTSLTISQTDVRTYYTNQPSRVCETIWNGTTYSNSTLPSAEVRPSSFLTSIQIAGNVRVYYINIANQINELSSTAPGNWTNTLLPSTQVRSDSPLAALTLANGDPRIYYIDTSDQINELAWVGTWVNNLLPSAFGGAQLVSPYSGLTCFAMNGTDSRVYYAGRFGSLSAFNWVNGAWANEEFGLGGPAGFITLGMGGAMASFQGGDSPHLLVIRDNILSEVQLAAGATEGTGQWRVAGISQTQVRQPSSMALVQLNGGGRKVFFVGRDAGMYVATWNGGSESWNTESL